MSHLGGVPAAVHRRTSHRTPGLDGPLDDVRGMAHTAGGQERLLQLPRSFPKRFLGQQPLDQRRSCGAVKRRYEAQARPRVFQPGGHSRLIGKPRQGDHRHAVKERFQGRVQAGVRDHDRGFLEQRQLGAKSTTTGSPGRWPS